MSGQLPSDRTIQIADALRSGRTHDDIAREFGVTRQRVGQIRHRYDIPAKSKEKPPKLPDPRLWTADELAFVVEHQDDAIDDIASALGGKSGGVRAMWLNLVRRGLVPLRRRLLTDFDTQLINDLTLSMFEVAIAARRRPPVSGDGQPGVPEG